MVSVENWEATGYQVGTKWAPSGHQVGANWHDTQLSGSNRVEGLSNLLQLLHNMCFNM